MERRNYFLIILIALSAIGLAGCAAYFSVTGLSKLFAGAMMEVIIMAGFLEFAKLVTASFIHRRWNQISRFMKIQFTSAVVILMLITSAGIYGFLSNAYSLTSNELEKNNQKIGLVELEIEQKEDNIVGVEGLISNKRNRVDNLNEQISNQQITIDSLYGRRHYTSARKIESQMERNNGEVLKLNSEIDSLSGVINDYRTEINDKSINIIELKNTDVNAELGPLIYISNLTGKPIDDVINWYILALIFVFDPLAVGLVLALNIELKRGGKRDKKQPKKEEPKVDKVEKKVETAKKKSENEEIKVEESRGEIDKKPIKKEYVIDNKEPLEEEKPKEVEVKSEEKVVEDKVKEEPKKESHKAKITKEDIEKARQKNRGFSKPIPPNKKERGGNINRV